MHISTLSVREKQIVFGQEAVELAETPADTDIEERLVGGLIQDFQVVVEILESRLQVKQDVGTGSGGGATVLVATALDRNGDFVRFCVLEGSNDVSVAGWLHDQSWIHIVIDLVRA
jgi:hypothetical protein